MSQSWFALIVVISVVFLSGLVIAVALMRAAWAQREREALSASDLRAVEESAVLLIDQLRSQADTSISELDARCVELRNLIAEADAKLAALRDALPTEPRTDETVEPLTVNRLSRTQDILRLASEGLDSVEIARATGVDCADVKVAMKLGALAEGLRG